MKKKYIWILQGALTFVSAYLSEKLGLLFPVLCVFGIMMTIDYITGMLASKVEALEHPEDPNYGWNSKKGAKGIIKKVSYLCVITVAIVVDYLLFTVVGEVGIKTTATTFFSLLVSVWYLLNEMLSIIENAGRMGANVPEWLVKYIAILKNRIDSQDYDKI